MTETATLLFPLPDEIRTSAQNIGNKQPLHFDSSNLPLFRPHGDSKRSEHNTPRKALHMGQKIARHKVESGVRLYHDSKQEQALRKWLAALSTLRTPAERFITLGYLAQTNGEMGRFRDMLVYALHQIDLANEQASPYMRAEAYLNLSRSNDRLAEYHKTVSYARHALQNESDDPRTAGFAYLSMGQGFIGFSNFPRALESFELAMQVANSCDDKLLELQISVALGNLFSQIKDLNKAWLFLDNANKLLDTVRIKDVYQKYNCLVQYHLAYIALQRHEIESAKSLCEGALTAAKSQNIKPMHARCLVRLGDVYRVMRDADECWANYEQGYQLMLEMNDRQGQVASLAAMAKSTAALLVASPAQCECQSLELNRKCLEMSKAIGNKLAQLKSHSRLHSLFVSLGDSQSAKDEESAVHRLIAELETFCNFCGAPYGITDTSLQAMPCSHIFHEKCLQERLHSSSGPCTSESPGSLECPKCLLAPTANAQSSSLDQCSPVL